MTADKSETKTPQSSQPHPALKRMDILVGTWNMKGHTLDSTEDNIFGWNTFEWLPGGFFLKSTGEIDFKGEKIHSLEIIGYDPSTDTFPSQVYSNMDGQVLPYSWNVQGNVVTHTDATSIYTGTISDDGKTLSGGWRPKEGKQASPENSYDAFMTRM